MKQIWSTQIWIIAVCVLIYGCQAPVTEQSLVDGGLQPMKTAEIESVFVDATVYGTTPRGGNIVEYVAPDGTTKYEQGGKVHDGVWTISNDVICFMYPAVDPGTKHCHRVYMKDDVLFSFHIEGQKAGEPSGTINKVVKGNVEGY